MSEGKSWQDRGDPVCRERVFFRVRAAGKILKHKDVFYME